MKRRISQADAIRSMCTPFRVTQTRPLSVSAVAAVSIYRGQSRRWPGALVRRVHRSLSCVNSPSYMSNRNSPSLGLYSFAGTNLNWEFTIRHHSVSAIAQAMRSATISHGHHASKRSRRSHPDRGPHHPSLSPYSHDDRPSSLPCPIFPECTLPCLRTWSASRWRPSPPGVFVTWTSSPRPV